MTNNDGLQESISIEGYKKIKDPETNKWVFAHRYVWKKYYGKYPNGILDHINGDRTDNRIENLRLVTLAQNSWNRKTSKASKTGYKGVVFDGNTRKFLVGIRKHGKQISLGYFENSNDGAKRYNEEATKLFGEFARLNEITEDKNMNAKDIRKNQVKITLDENIMEKLQEKASGLGLKLSTYIQLVLGQHVQDTDKKDKN